MKPLSPLSPWIIVDDGACGHPIIYIAGRWNSEAGARAELAALLRLAAPEWKERLRVAYSPELLEKCCGKAANIASQNRAHAQIRSAEMKAYWRRRLAAG